MWDRTDEGRMCGREEGRGGVCVASDRMLRDAGRVTESVCGAAGAVEPAKEGGAEDPLEARPRQGVC
eukprot:8246719-Pyramimonas_sp.AAC.1